MCDCGYSFSAENPETVQAELGAAQRRARHGIVCGLVMAGIALLASLFSFVVAKPGGMFIIAYGGVVTGLALAGRSWSTLHRLADARKENEAATPQV